jgi:hypothetical protein
MTISISRRGFAGLGLASLLPSAVSAQSAVPLRGLSSRKAGLMVIR